MEELQLRTGRLWGKYFPPPLTSYLPHEKASEKSSCSLSLYWYFYALSALKNSESQKERTGLQRQHGSTGHCHDNYSRKSLSAPFQPVVVLQASSSYNFKRSNKNFSLTAQRQAEANMRSSDAMSLLIRLQPRNHYSKPFISWGSITIIIH